MTEFDRLQVWSDAATRRHLDWYREVAANRRPAKFRIAAPTPTPRRVGWSSVVT